MPARALRFVLLLTAVGCGRSGAVRGVEFTPCYPNGTCDHGLLCNTAFVCENIDAEWCRFAGGDLALNGDANLAANRLRVASGGLDENSSAFCRNQVPINAFATMFSVSIPLSGADGMTFTVQNDGPEAIGSTGGGLGFGPDPDNVPIPEHGIGLSVAVKLDLYSNSGEGPSSTGVFLNGEPPDLPSSDLRPHGIDLHALHTLRLRIEYVNHVLTLTITDLNTSAVFQEDFAVNLPGTVGSDVAHVGFTGATGGRGAIIEVFNWTLGPL